VRVRTLTLTLLSVLALAVAGCGESKQTATSSTADAPATFPTGTVVIVTGEADVGIEVEVASTEELLEQGLMNRESLAEDAGMFFVFPSEQVDVGFWMKDTLIPLSVAVADADGRITRIVDMEPCEAEPCAIYDVGSFVTALEVNQGAFADWGVEVGDTMELQSR
jgi:uncharacterized membrane protein (UPF0127 family)